MSKCYCIACVLSSLIKRIYILYCIVLYVQTLLTNNLPTYLSPQCTLGLLSQVLISRTTITSRLKFSGDMSKPLCVKTTLHKVAQTTTSYIVIIKRSSYKNTSIYVAMPVITLLCLIYFINITIFPKIVNDEFASFCLELSVPVCVNKNITDAHSRHRFGRLQYKRNITRA